MTTGEVLLGVVAALTALVGALVEFRMRRDDSHLREHVANLDARVNTLEYDTGRLTERMDELDRTAKRRK